LIAFGNSKKICVDKRLRKEPRGKAQQLEGEGLGISVIIKKEKGTLEKNIPTKVTAQGRRCRFCWAEKVERVGGRLQIGGEK